MCNTLQMLVNMSGSVIADYFINNLDCVMLSTRDSFTIISKAHWLSFKKYIYIRTNIYWDQATFSLQAERIFAWPYNK